MYLIGIRGVTMFSFIKKIFALFNGEDSSTSTLMERAMKQSLNERAGRASFWSSEVSSFAKYDVHDELEEMWLRQQMEDSHDPYKNPGLDGNIDQHYHGIDHGLDDGMDHHHHDH